MKNFNHFRIFLFSLLFIVLLVTAKVTQDYRSEADRQLKHETDLTAKYTQQHKTDKQVKEDFERERREAQRRRQYGY